MEDNAFVGMDDRGNTIGSQINLWVSGTDLIAGSWKEDCAFLVMEDRGNGIGSQINWWMNGMDSLLGIF